MIKRKKVPLLPAARDRGGSPYFHGREDVLSNLGEIMSRAKQSKTGTIFLIQGAPGAGKTALLDQCKNLPLSRGWHVAKIKSGALWYPDQLVDSLGKKPRVQLTGGSVQFGVDDDVKANVKLDVAVKYATLTILKILKSRKKPLLLILDEAQSLGKPDVIPPDQRGVVTNVLDSIHNGELRKPVVLLAAGLGTTFRTFKSFGISRFGKNCIVQLGALDKKSERAVIRDWLTKYAKAEGDPTAWIDAIAQETHGWPQHIVAYVDPAIKYLENNNRQMTDEGLEFVLQRGAESRQEYYKLHAHDIDEDKRQAIAKSISDVPFGETMTRPAIMSGLQNSGLTHDDASELFGQVLEQGIIDKRDDSRYGIPIPSMQTWLLNEYGREKEKPQQMDKTTDKKREAKDSLAPEKVPKSRFTRER